MRAGMRGGGYVRLYVGVGGILIGQGEGDSGYYPAWTLTAECADPLPDLTDPATLGALLGAVRAAYPSWFAISCQYRGSVGKWHVVARREGFLDRHDHAILGEGKTEAEALLDAWAARPPAPR
jgi:hypothetical protein